MPAHDVLLNPHPVELPHEAIQRKKEEALAKLHAKQCAALSMASLGGPMPAYDVLFNPYPVELPQEAIQRKKEEAIAKLHAKQSMGAPMATPIVTPTTLPPARLGMLSLTTGTDISFAVSAPMHALGIPIDVNVRLVDKYAFEVCYNLHSQVLNGLLKSLPTRLWNEKTKRLSMSLTWALTDLKPNPNSMGLISLTLALKLISI